MGKPHSIDVFIKEAEYQLAKYKLVKEHFPDARCSAYGEFTSKTVNTQYNKWDFLTNYGGLFVAPYCEVKLEFDGAEEMVKVHSSPRNSRLVYLRRYSAPKSLKFSRLSINLKNNKFKDDMLNSCRAEIMNFIKNNPGYKLDDKHLEPRLKKLLLFT